VQRELDLYFQATCPGDRQGRVPRSKHCRRHETSRSKRRQERGDRLGLAPAAFAQADIGLGAVEDPGVGGFRMAEE
jgi:hypothetical protein